METDQLTIETALQEVKAKEEKNETLVCSLTLYFAFAAKSLKCV